MGNRLHSPGGWGGQCDVTKPLTWILPTRSHIGERTNTHKVEP